MSHYLRRVVVPSAFSNLYSFLFDGFDESIDMGNRTDLRFDIDTPFSISVWFKTKDVNAGQGLFVKRNAGVGSNSGYFMSIANSNIRFLMQETVGGGATTIFVDSATTLLANTWYHGVVTYQGNSNRSGMKVYLDGSLDGSGTPSAITESIQNNLTVRIGAFSNTNGPMDGNIDEVSVYDFELSAAEVAELYNGGVPSNLNNFSGTAPIVWYRMGDEATYDGTDWTLVNQGTGGGTATSLNMELADRVNDVPS